MKNNSKQWAKAFMAIIIGALPLIIANYVHATWYYIFMVFCFLFLVLGAIAVFQLFIYTILFPYSRNSFVKTLYGLSILVAVSIPAFWIWHNESNPEKLLKSNFEIAEGVVQRTYYNSDSTKKYIQYSYKVEDKYYVKDALVSKFPTYKNINIKYLPEKPDISEVVVE